MFVFKVFTSYKSIAFVLEIPRKLYHSFRANAGPSQIYKTSGCEKTKHAH